MDQILVASLIEFLDAAAIRAAWKSVLQAHMGGLSTTVVITGSQLEGEAHSGIVLDKPELRENFMRACQEALRRLGDPGNPAAAPDGGGQPHVRFDLSPVRV
jgi:hypothetical protein